MKLYATRHLSTGWRETVLAHDFKDAAQRLGKEKYPNEVEATTPEIEELINRIGSSGHDGCDSRYVVLLIVRDFIQTHISKGLADAIDKACFK